MMFNLKYKILPLWFDNFDGVYPDFIFISGMVRINYKLCSSYRIKIC